MGSWALRAQARQGVPLDKRLPASSIAEAAPESPLHLARGTVSRGNSSLARKDSSGRPGLISLESNVTSRGVLGSRAVAAGIAACRLAKLTPGSVEPGGQETGSLSAVVGTQTAASHVLFCVIPRSPVDTVTSTWPRSQPPCLRELPAADLCPDWPSYLPDPKALCPHLGQARFCLRTLAPAAENTLSSDLHPAATASR